MPHLPFAVQQVHLPLVTVSATRYFKAVADDVNDEPFVEGTTILYGTPELYEYIASFMWSVRSPLSCKR